MLPTTRDPWEKRTMNTDATCCLVFDLGAGSGRAMLVEFTGDSLAVRELHRFSGYEVRLDDGPARTRALGYISRGGTLNVSGMLFANRCTWAHAVDAAAATAGWRREDVLDPSLLRAIDGLGDPADLLVSQDR